MSEGHPIWGQPPSDPSYHGYPDPATYSGVSGYHVSAGGLVHNGIPAPNTMHSLVRVPSAPVISGGFGAIQPSGPHPYQYPHQSPVLIEPRPNAAYAASPEWGHAPPTSVSVPYHTEYQPVPMSAVAPSPQYAMPPPQHPSISSSYDDVYPEAMVPIGASPAGTVSTPSVGGTPFTYTAPTPGTHLGWVSGDHPTVSVRLLACQPTSVPLILLVYLQTDPGTMSTIYSPMDYPSYSSTPATMAQPTSQPHTTHANDLIASADNQDHRFPKKRSYTSLAGALG